MANKRFTGKEGQLVSAAKASELITPHQKKEKECLQRGENYVRAEFFGIHTFNELIGLHGDQCVGFRVYYGVKDEEEFGADVITPKTKRPTPRLVLVPVDENGKDLIVSAQFGGLKDMPPQKEAMTGGPLCPNEC